MVSVNKKNNYDLWFHYFVVAGTIIHFEKRLGKSILLGKHLNIIWEVQVKDVSFNFCFKVSEIFLISYKKHLKTYTSENVFIYKIIEST